MPWQKLCETNQFAWSLWKYFIHKVQKTFSGHKCGLFFYEFLLSPPPSPPPFFLMLFTFLLLWSFFFALKKSFLKTLISSPYGKNENLYDLYVTMYDIYIKWANLRSYRGKLNNTSCILSSRVDCRVILVKFYRRVNGEW